MRATVSASVTISIEISGKSIELTPDEAREVHATLGRVLATPQMTWPPGVRTPVDVPPVVTCGTAT